MFCKHKWEILSEITTKSKFESSLNAYIAAGAVGSAKLPHQLCDADRKFIQVVSCGKCGKLKRFVNDI